MVADREGHAVVTSDDVARAAGVSRPAVSQILNGRGERFTPETRERVLRAARELSYKPSFAGRALALGRSDAVVALIPNTTFGGQLQDVIEGATTELGLAGFTLLTYFAGSGTVGLERLLSAVRPAALMPIGEGDAGLEALLASHPGTVLAAHPRGVQESSELIGSMQAEHLIGRGYRLLRFAGFLDTRADVFGASRQRGFEQACAAHGIDTLPAWQIELSHRAAHACVSEEHHSPLGVACYNDEVALTLLSAALAKGLRVPDDVGFVGVDRTPLGQAISTPLTTVAYDAREAGRGLARFALSCLGVLDQPSSPDNGFGVSQGATT